MILAVTLRDDLHALSVQHAVRSRGHCEFHIVECDTISGAQNISWHRSHDRDADRSSVLTSEGRRIHVGDAHVLWWRRVRADQQTVDSATNDQQRNLVNNDCRGALAGVLASGFRGQWISPADATDRASDKIYQLAVARDAGWRIPRTLISQSREDVREFMASVGRVIVKPVVGARGPSLWTGFLEEGHSIPAESFEVCPAVYQEYIPGSRHVRLNCFGDRMYASVIETDELDWRPNLGVPISHYSIPGDVEAMVADVLRRLNLRMGVIDLKLTPDGEPVWLEVNPQGQFLFLEALTGEPLTEHFADFVLSVDNLREASKTVAAVRFTSQSQVAATH